ncbi:hypothetical protein IAQ61_001842 [Plenodomus lingam]|uniref:uncharacterized protein n=1 Tax=Leptosphaeria maculans TaxID=5022 RepID=UPI0033337038|nr:hypothetical protein IAQ61_001842 [Plenodomus lingam]
MVKVTKLLQDCPTSCRNLLNVRYEFGSAIIQGPKSKSQSIVCGLGSLSEMRHFLVQANQPHMPCPFGLGTIDADAAHTNAR